MKHRVNIGVITVVAFMTYFGISKLYFGEIRAFLDRFIGQLGVSHILTYVIVGIPVLIALIILHGKNQLFRSIGFEASISRALKFSLLCTVPMLLGYAIVFDYNSDFSINHLMITVIAAALFEEIYFRGFLYGQIYRYTNLGFIPSVLVGAVIFGLVHIYQGNELHEVIGVFLVTFMGGVLYAWVFTEWKFNLWVPIFLHLFMNLFWGLFSAGSNALGGVYSNVFRIITIVLIITLTIRYKTKRNIKLEINRRTLWMKK